MKNTYTNTARILVMTAALAGLTACTGMTNTQQRTLSGAAIGTGVGAVGGAVTGGCITCGAVIGGAAGAAGGYIYDQTKKR